MPASPRHLAVTALATGLLILTACGNGDDNARPSDDVPSGNTATTQPTKTTNAPTTTTPTKTEAPKPTKQGAIDTAIAGIKAIDHAYATWDVGPLRRLSEGGCSACQDIISTLPAKHREGYSMSGGRFTITGPTTLAAGVVQNGSVLIKVPVSVSKLITLDESGKPYNKDDAAGSEPAYEHIVANVDLGWHDDRWTVSRVGFNS